MGIGNIQGGPESQPMIFGNYKKNQILKKKKNRRGSKKNKLS